jgi:DNA replication and repair protein RecF
MTELSLCELTLSHFRSHKRIELAFDPKPITIFGPNGSGKTNPKELGWKISGVLNSLRQTHELETWAEAGSPRQLRIDGKAAPQTALGRIARVLWLVPSMDRLWIEGAEGRRRFLDRATLSFEPTHADAVLSYERAMRERNRLLKDMVRDPHWYTAIEAQMADASIAIQANRQKAITELAEAQAETQTAFPTATLTLISPEPVPDDLQVALADHRPRDMAAGRTLIGPHRADLDAVFTDKAVPAKVCSTGEQKALLISLMLANGRALARDFGAPPILLLDEVAAHLDASRRAALYDEICDLGAQAFMTGTGVELFAELGDRAQHLEVTETDGATTVTRKEIP